MLGVLLLAAAAVGIWRLLSGGGEGITYTPLEMRAYIDEAGVPVFLVDDEVVRYPGPAKEASRSPNGEHVVVVGTDGRMFCYDSPQSAGVAVAEDVWLIQHNVNDTGAYYMAGDGALYHYNFETGKQSMVAAPQVWNGGYSPDDNRFAQIGDDGTLSVFDAVSGEVQVLGYVDSSGSINGVTNDGKHVFWSVTAEGGFVLRHTGADGVTERMGVITAANYATSVWRLQFNDGNNAVFYAPGGYEILLWDAEEGVTTVTLPHPLSYDEMVGRNGLVPDSEDDRTDELFFTVDKLDGGYSVYGLNMDGEHRLVADGVGQYREIRNGKLYYTPVHDDALYCKELDGEEGTGSCIALNTVRTYVSRTGEYVYVQDRSSLYFSKQGGALQRITDKLGEGEVYLTEEEGVIYYVENPTPVAYSYAFSGTLFRWQDDGSEPQPILQDVLFLVKQGEQYHDPNRPVAARFNRYVEREGFVYDMVVCEEGGERILLTDILY